MRIKIKIKIKIRRKMKKICEDKGSRNLVSYEICRNIALAKRE
jgi:hypothetical protein